MRMSQYGTYFVFWQGSGCCVEKPFSTGSRLTAAGESHCRYGKDQGQNEPISSVPFQNTTSKNLYFVIAWHENTRNYAIAFLGKMGRKACSVPSGPVFGEFGNYPI
jgi:hypothetical protein